MKLTLECVEKNFNKLKFLIKVEIKKRNYKNACSIIQCCANIAYHLNFKYVDEELENYLFEMSQNLISSPEFIPNKNRWVFYDSFGLDNRGLTQQYLNALDSWGVEYLYILEKPKDMNSCRNIIKQVKNNKMAQLYIIESNDINNLNFMEIQKKIDEFAPNNVFIHISPWSVFAIMIWIKYKSLVKRYLINLTDHAFWLGKSCLDFSIEFRDYGCNVSNKFRSIENNQIIKQIYYPILISSDFKGLPKIEKDKIVLFTGGSFYKMYGENFSFLNILKRISNENNNSIILIAGNGNEKPLIEFIKNNNLINKIFLIGNRTDISEVFKRIDVYINTYPFIGGLMSQYAIMNNKPLIGFNDKNIPCNNAEGLFETNNLKFTYFNLEEFHHEINKLIQDSKYRNEKKLNYENLIPSKEKFSTDLQNKLYKNEIAVYEDIEIDIIRFSNIYFDIENNYLKEYDLIKFRWLGLKYFKYDFFGAFISTIKILINHRKLIIRKIVKKLKLVR